ncbi:MAG: hypothetical protein JKY40_10370 [Gammaproteobacteria bacterium]|nr:hypothetical protein [Gammaproteobacteria bacterium]
MTQASDTIESKFRTIWAYHILGETASYSLVKSACDQALQANIYHEFLRTNCCDPPHKDHLVFIEEFKAALADLFPSVLDLDHGQALLIYTRCSLQRIQEQDSTNLDSYLELAIVLDEQAELEYDSLQVGPIIELAFKWFYDYADWMIGDEFETQRLKSISELQTAAREWIAQHSPQM